MWGENMKKTFKFLSIIFLVLIISIVPLFNITADAVTHIVIKGESMWLIAKKYQVGLSEIISANPQVENPNLIYPKQKLEVPLYDKNILDFEAEVIRLTNQRRTENGLSALKTNWELSRVARYKSQDMHDKKYFSHTSPTYGSPFDMIRNFNIKFNSAGENIAMGQKTPQEVVNAWMNSPGHRANILKASFTQIGVGYVANGNYWTQMFIG